MKHAKNILEYAKIHRKHTKIYRNILTYLLAQSRQPVILNLQAPQRALPAADKSGLFTTHALLTRWLQAGVAVLLASGK